MVAKNAARGYGAGGLNRRQMAGVIAAGVLAAWRPAVAVEAQPDAVELTADQQPGRAQQVATVIEVAGELSLNSDGQKVRRMPMQAKAELRYVERFLPENQGKTPLAARQYRQAQTAIRIQESQIDQQLRDDRRLILLERGQSPTLYSPAGPLTREELDLIDTAASSAHLDRLLPGKAIEVGGTWTISDDAAARLLGLEAIGHQELNAKLEKIEDGLAIIHLAGKVSGAVGGVSSEIDLEGKANYHLKRKTLSWLAIEYHEKRAIGHAQPGYDAVIRIRVQTEPASPPAELSDGALAGLLDKPKTGRLEFRAEKAGIAFLQDRRWQVMVDRFDTVIMRLVDRGDLIAQCNVTRLAQLPKGQQLSLAVFQDDVSQTLAKNQRQIAEAAQFETADGLRALKITVAGSASDLPIQWIYYHVSSGDGRRASLVFTMEGKLAERFGQLDRELIDSLKLSPTPLEETTEPTPAPKAKSARGKSATMSK